MRNMATIISLHNQILKPSVFALDTKHVYQVDFSNNFFNESKCYYGLSETLLKERCSNHKVYLDTKDPAMPHKYPSMFRSYKSEEKNL